MKTKLLTAVALCGLTINGLCQQASAAPGPRQWGLGAVKAAVCADGSHLAVNNRGELWTSKDHNTWQYKELTVRTFLRGATYGNGLFVIVGGSYLDEPGVILTCRDGKTVIRRKSPTKANLYSVAYGQGQFVAVGDKDTLLTSKDGVVWKRQAARTQDVQFSAVTFGNGTFVAVGDSGTVLTSTDGITWQSRHSGTASYLSKASWDAGWFVVSGGDGTLLTSADGVEWTSQNSEASTRLASSLPTATAVQ